jgi:ZIP family zinc transporter
MDGGNHLFSLIGLALLPAAGMLCGALAAEWWKLSGHAVGAMLHAAAGVAVGVVSVELMPRILEDIRPWQLVAAFCIGAAASVAMAKGVRHAVSALEVGGTGPWKVYLAVAIDLLGDGLMIGIGSAVATGVSLMLGLSQVVGNLPGGFVAIANLRDKGMPAFTARFPSAPSAPAAPPSRSLRGLHATPHRSRRASVR